MRKLILILILLTLGITNVKGQSANAIIKGEINSLNDGDTAILTIMEFGEPLFMTNKDLNCAIVNHSFTFSIPAYSHPVHIKIKFIEKANDFHHLNKLITLILNNYLVENGDRVTIKEHDLHYTFEGKGAEKFRLKNSFSIIDKTHLGGYSQDKPENLLLTYKKSDTVFMEKMRLLESRKMKISGSIFVLLKADCLGDLYFKNHRLGDKPDSQINIALKAVNGYKSIIPSKYLDVKNLEKSELLKYSSAYTYFGLLDQYKFDSCVVVKRYFNISKYFNYIKAKYQGGLRERMLMNLLIYTRDSAEDIRPLVSRSLKIIKDKTFKNLLDELISNRLAGAAAINFTLPDTSGKLHSFSDFKGKVVLMDFWFTGCGSCAAAKPFLEKVEEHFKGQPVVFITINNDKNKNLWIKSVRSNVYTSPLSLNLFTEGMAFDHPLSKHYNILGGPYFILVGKNGLLTVNPENPSFDNGVQLTDLITSEINK